LRTGVLWSFAYRGNTRHALEMIPRLWQCADPTWWEQLLSIPLSSYTVILLLAVYCALRGWQSGPRSRVVEKLLVVTWAANLAILGLGFLIGLVLRVGGGNPSWGYETMRLVWILAGWPLVGLTVWRYWRRSGDTESPAQPPRWIDRVVLTLVAGVIVSVAVLLAYVRNSEEQNVHLARNFFENVFDDFTPWFATDECLVEHSLEYLARKHDGTLIDFRQGPGLSAGAEINGRRPHVDPHSAVLALRSYRRKVREARLPEPETLDGLWYKRDPGVQAELRAWAQDPRHSKASRELAAQALQEILHPKPPPPKVDTERFMLRTPRSAPSRAAAP